MMQAPKRESVTIKESDRARIVLCGPIPRVSDTHASKLGSVLK
jgi:hypothetical protein